MSVYGFIGLGAMGMGMAQSMVRAGLETWAYDINADALAAFTAEGGKAAPSVADLAAKSDVLTLAVVNAAQVDDVLFGGGNAAAHLKPGSLVIACSTVKPEDAERAGARLAEKGILFLDAPMSGGAAKAMQGQITYMASGSDEAFAKAEPVIRATAAKMYRMGDKPGKGSAMKIVHQLLAGVHIAAAAEGLAFGIRMGLDPQTVYDVVTNAAGNSWMFENRMAHVLDGDYTPLSAVDIFVKDLGLVLDSTRKVTFPAPLAAAAHQQFINASAAGHGREDDAAVIKIVPGITLPEGKKK
ncbi:putative dehydrogenase, with NAD(P)-binding Rossmann-fold domain [uncultured delta proteobacterium]|uniref:L-threonate dehydrogenase n=1 Tax=uncultured delta proteobacterium TaxID=34034 RepID=A0A212J9C3_9DELT|nr:putative dehydrogenase, with NAD(P)-binding Rossmann-fold domain [uncultured delta proteobacterium]